MKFVLLLHYVKIPVTYARGAITLFLGAEKAGQTE